ncbi:hypothetical protein BGY98DRAFT_1038981 [Russula aff. rugulosa BPL654]|nr:hypothetical protein BGY98DRAFT_1038981 [Russula aff. rugulosa BPL654]
MAVDQLLQTICPSILTTAPFLFCVSLVCTIFLYYVFACHLSYSSPVKPAANKEVDAHLPHIIIELPMYKESLVTLVQTMCVTFLTTHYNVSAS